MYIEHVFYYYVRSFTEKAKEPEYKYEITDNITAQILLCLDSSKQFVDKDKPFTRKQG